MSGTSNVLPMVAVAQKAAANSNAVHLKKRALQNKTSSRESVTAREDRSIASNNERDSMHTNLEGRVNAAFRQEKTDSTKSKDDSKNPQQAAFNEVLNRKMAAKDEKTSETAEVKEEENTETSKNSQDKPAEEFIFSSFIHNLNTKTTDDAQGQSSGEQNTSAKAGSDQAAITQSLTTEGQKAQAGDQQVAGQSTGTSAVDKETSAESQQLTKNLQTVSDVSTPLKEGKAEVQGSVSESAATAQQTANQAQNAEKTAINDQKTAPGQGVAVESKEGAVKTDGQKEILASEALDKAAKGDKALEGQKMGVSDASAKEVAAQQGLQSKQNEQGQQQSSLQSGANEAKKSGFQVETAEQEVSKTEFQVNKAVESGAMNAHTQAQQSEHISINMQEPGARISTDSSAQAVEATDKAASVMNTMSARPIDQIIQQLNVSYSGTNQQIRLTLTPEDLGTVRLTFRQIEGEVVGMVEVQKENTRKEIENALPQLVSAMQENGVQIRRVEVVQWNNPDQQQSKQGSSEGFSLSQEREFAQQTSQGSSNSSGSGAGRSSHGQGNSMQTGRIRLQEISDSGQLYTQKGLNFLV